MPERAERRADDTLTESLVGHIRHIVDPHPVGPLGRIKIFAPKLHATGRTRVVTMFLLKNAAIGSVSAVIIGIGVALQVTSYHRLRFIPFRNLYRRYCVFQTEPDIETDKVDEICSKQQQLRHCGIVVPVRRQVTLHAGLGLSLACRVGKMRVKSL
ncbi:hypothetical protein MnTg04_01191 [bacterium MnTg04]|nr:hypothetical protein MnTg04_01191 [bacterium MnTg04]